MKEIQKGYDLLVRGGNAAEGCSSIWTGTRGGENYCGNLLWQSCLTMLFSDHVVSLLFPLLTAQPPLCYNMLVFGCFRIVELSCENKDWKN